MKFSASIAMAPPDQYIPIARLIWGGETPMVGGTLQGRIDGLNRFADTIVAKVQ
jgi:hypothetical protein